VIRNAFGRTDALVGAGTVALGLIACLVVGLTTSDQEYIILTGVTTAILGVFVDLRVRWEEYSQQNQPEIEGQFRKFARDPCPLFAKVAGDKEDEVREFLRDLSEDRIELRSQDEILRTLEFLFTEVDDIVTIWATSSGELEEWVVPTTWSNNYLRIQKDTIHKGKAIHRIFITGPAESAQKLEMVRKRLEADGIQTYRVGRVGVPDRSMRFSNAIVFMNSERNPLYGLFAVHQDGVVDDVRITRSEHELYEMMDALRPIVSQSVLPDVRNRQWKDMKRPPR